MDRLKIYENLKQEEGCRLKKYNDSVGIPTIGIGHNLYASPIDKIIGCKFNGLTITEAQCRIIFDSDLNKVIADLDRELCWWNSLDDARRYVMISLCFNLGIGGLLKFKNTLACFRAHNWEGAAAGLKASLWAKQVHGRSDKLIAIVRTGKWS